MFPMKLIEEFTKLINTCFTSYGNIYAGEVLLTLIAKMMTSTGWLLITISNSIRDGLDRVLLVYR